VPSADKRQRKKDNARAAREAREAAAKRKKRFRTIRNGAIIAALFILFIVIIQVVTNDDGGDVQTTSSTTVAPETPTTVAVSTPDLELAADKTYTATIETNFGDIVVELDNKNAPVGAGHFVKAAREGVYDGSRWHRIVNDFVIQGGAPDGDLTKNYSSLVAEVPTDNYPVGTIAAAKTGDAPPGTFDSQFFIVTGEEKGKSLPNDYARFGKVTKGMDVVEKIEGLKLKSGTEEPEGEATIEKVTITES
jgi:cyclophilin family peptidyl-prolyl cis-trans isomerase